LAKPDLWQIGFCTYADGSKQSAEIHAGSGYLSQSAPIAVFFANSSTNFVVEIAFRWPDGHRNTHNPRNEPLRIIRRQKKSPAQ
jgi:hypothetical protein